MNILNSDNNSFLDITNYDCFPQIVRYLGTIDLVRLSSSCKTLRVSQAIWDTLSYGYHQPQGSSADHLLKYLNTPIDITIYHLSSGVYRRSLSKNHYKIYPTTQLIDIQKAVQETSQKDQDEEHCEIRLPKKNLIGPNTLPFYNMYKKEEKSIVLSKDIKQDSSDLTTQHTFYSIPASSDYPAEYDISTFLQPIYEAIVDDPDSSFSKPEVGPFGLFSLERKNWKPLNSIEFFRKNHFLDKEKEIGSLKERALLVITDISHTENDKNTPIPLQDLSEADNDRYVCFSF